MTEWIIDLIRQSGPLGVGFLMFLETVFPPIPSEVVMSLAGVAAQEGRFTLGAAIAAGTTGAMFGNIFWYLLARALGAIRLEKFVRKYGRWLTMDWNEVQKAEKWFARHGGAFVLVGRLIPTIRSLISVPAGLLRMRFLPFVIYSTIGTAGWTTLLAMAGYKAGSLFDDGTHWLNTGATILVGILILAYFWRLFRYDRTHKS